MRLVERVGTLQKAVIRRLRRHLAAHTDRPYQQLKALLTIARGETPCTQTELADKLLIDAAATSRLIDRLVAEGLVARGTADDRRCVRLTVTRAAARELAVFEEAIAEVERDLVAAIGHDDAMRLARALGHLADTLVDDGAPAAAPPTARTGSGRSPRSTRRRSSPTRRGAASPRARRRS